MFIRLALPSQFVISFLGGAGSPAAILSLAGLGWWALARLHRADRVAASPVVGAALVFAGAMAMRSYAAAAIRPTPADEFNLATLSMLILAGWLGMLLVAHDGIDDRDRLLVLMNRLSVFAALFGGFGLLQVATGQAFVDRLSLPGLTINQVIYSISTREGFVRPAGTAVHPIEFGAVLCMLLPIALGRALGYFDRPGLGSRSLVSRWFPAMVVVSAISLSVTRSAIVGLLVATVAMTPALTKVQRFFGAVGLAVVGLLIFLFVPGMAGSVLGLFTGINGDVGVSSRLDSFAETEGYFLASPWVGRGFGTFLPRYRSLDNQYLALSLRQASSASLRVAALIGTVISAARRASQVQRSHAPGDRPGHRSGGIGWRRVHGAVDRSPSR